MYLCHRGRSQRLAVEASEHFTDLGAKLGLDQRPRVFRVEGRHLILQLGQFIGDIPWQQVAPGGEQLAEFYEDRPELFQGQAQACAA